MLSNSNIDHIVEVEKFNPYHDAKGRFASANSAASFTYAPGKSKAHDTAIAREKDKAGAQKGFKGTLYHGSPNTDIEEFDINRAGKNTSSGEKLIFFTDSKQMADDFSYERIDTDSKFTQERGAKGRVYEVDVEMKKPLDFRNLSDTDIDNILKLDEEGLLTKDMVKQLSANHQLLKASLTLTSDSLKNLGYDGLIAETGKAGHNSLEYAVVDSKQAKIIKSVAKSFDEIIEIVKFNPYHDRLGRFASANGHTTFSATPGKSKAHDNAIAREKERVRLLGNKEKENKPFENISEETAHKMRSAMGQDLAGSEDANIMQNEQSGYFGSKSSFSINKKLRNGETLTEEEQKTVETMDKNMRPLTDNIKVTRMATEDFVKSIAGDTYGKLLTCSPSEEDTIFENLKTSITGGTVTETAYMSTSYDAKKNRFKSRAVQMEIKVPKGTKALFSPIDNESEIVLPRNTSYRIDNVINRSYGDITLEVTIIS